MFRSTFARAASIGAGLAVAALVLTACGPRKQPPPPIIRIALVAGPAGFDDHGFNAAALAALQDCRRETNVVIESASSADVEAKLVLYATEKFDTLVAVGYGAAPAMATVARRFEGAHFALIDAVASQPNIQSITFREQEGAFLAGALAAIASKTHRVGFLGGADVPLIERSEAGFSAGAREADPGVRVTTRYLTSFDDAGAARTAADGLLAGGSDVLFAVAGPAGRGAFDAVALSRDARIIGVDTDQRALAPRNVLASVVKNVGGAVLRVCRETVGGKSESGPLVLGVADGGIDLTDLQPAIAALGKPAVARLERIRAALIAGRVTVPASRADLARFTPVSVP